MVIYASIDNESPEYQKTKDLMEKLGVEVIYLDNDLQKVK